MVGDGFGITGSLPAHSGMEAVQQRRKDMEAERDTVEAELAAVYTAEQRLWCDNRGYEDFVTGERCSRKFFDGMRKTVAFSYIHRAVSRTRQWCTTTGAVLDALRDFYCGPNGV